MEKFLVKSKDTIKDQFKDIRLIEAREYEVLTSYEDSFAIIDETGREAVFGKERFYEVKRINTHFIKIT